MRPSQKLHLFGSHSYLIYFGVRNILSRTRADSSEGNDIRGCLAEARENSREVQMAALLFSYLARFISSRHEDWASLMNVFVCIGTTASRQPIPRDEIHILLQPLLLHRRISIKAMFSRPHIQPDSTFRKLLLQRFHKSLAPSNRHR